MFDEIKAVYSRKNKELFLSIFDKEGNLLVSSHMPKLISYKEGEVVDGPNNEKYVVVDVKDEIFNPNKLHTAKLVKKEVYEQSHHENADEVENWV